MSDMNIKQFLEITNRLEKASNGHASYGSSDEPDWSDIMHTAHFCRIYGLFQDAIWCYDEAISITDALDVPLEGKQKMKSSVLSAKAMCLSIMGQNTDSIRVCEMAINLMPENHEAYCNKGIAHRNLGQISEAIDAHEIAISLNPDFQNSWNAIGQILVDYIKDYKKAITYLDKALELSNGEDTHAWINKGNALSYLGHLDEAFICWDTAYEIEPSRNIHAMLNKAMWLFKGKKDKTKSLALLNKVKHETSPSNPNYSQIVNLYNKIENEN